MKTIDYQTNTKLCNNCKISKPLEEFYDRGNGAYSSFCKTCIVKRKKESRKNGNITSKEYNRKVSLKSNYGLSVRQYDKLYNEQGGKCAICKTPQSELKKNLCVDHDHKTGKVRGLLCTLCNQGLGSFRDNQSNLEDALYYLILHK